MDLLKFVIFALAVLWVVWYSAGGPDRGQTKDPFIEPPPPIGTGDTYSIGGASGVKDETTGVSAETSLFDNKVSFYGKGTARLSDPAKEYVEIRAAKTNAAPVGISGWTIKSATTGKSAVIGNGVYTPAGGFVNPEQPIYLAPGSKAYITTGRSPKGYSFRLNLCTGYFEQFQNFSPSVPKECPLPKNEPYSTGPNGLTDACVEYIEGLRRCETHTTPLPISFSNDPICQEYVADTINYDWCVSAHKNEADFYETEWRVFLGRDTELWKESRETILLLDESGKAVDSVSY